MARRLSRRQAELLAAMRRGVLVYYMGGPDAYFFRSDTHKTVSSTFLALEARDLVKRTWFGHRVLIEVTEAGKTCPLE